MDDRDVPDELPPEGRLLEQARDRLDISQNEAARRAGITGTYWRQVVRDKAPGLTTERGVRTLVKMAQAVRVQADQFEDIGREDVAAKLRARDGAPAPTVEELAARLAELEAKFDELMGRDQRREAG